MATYLLLFERERLGGTSEQGFRDLIFDYADRWAFVPLGRHQLDRDVFRKPCDDDEITERDMLVCTVEFAGTAEELVKKLDTDCHETSAGGYFTVVGEVRGTISPVVVDYAKVLADAYLTDRVEA